MDRTSTRPDHTDPAASVNMPPETEFMRQIGKIRYNGWMTTASNWELYVSQAFWRGYRHEKQTEEGKQYWLQLREKQGVTELFLLFRSDCGGQAMSFEDQAKQLLIIEKVLSVATLDVKRVKFWYTRCELMRLCVKQLAGLYQLCCTKKEPPTEQIMLLQSNMSRATTHLDALLQQGLHPEDIGAAANPYGKALENLAECWSGSLRLNVLPISADSIPTRETVSIWPEMPQSAKTGPFPQLLLQTAKLFSAEREVRVLAGRMRALCGEGRSVNVVDRLGDLFFKSGRNASRIGIMEKLQWDIACILGLQDRCAPTKTCTLGVANGERKLKLGKLVEQRRLGLWKLKDGSGDPKVLRFDEDSVIAFDCAEVSAYRGSIQGAIEGKLFRDLSAKEALQIPLEEVCDAVLDAVIEGCSDLTSSNAIWDGHQLRFFDRSRDFVHANDYLLLGIGLIPAFRCALLDLTQCAQELPAEQVLRMEEKVKQVQERLPKLEAYFKSRATLCLVDSLDRGWLDPQLSLTALKERLLRLEQILRTTREQEAPLNLRRMVYHVFPEARLQVCVHLALSICLKMSRRENWAQLKQMPFSVVGGMLLNAPQTTQLWNFCTMEMSAVRKFAEDPEPNFQAIEDYVKQRVQAITRSEGDAFAEDPGFTEWVAELQERATVDYKDVGPDAIEELTKQRASELLAELKEHSAACFFGSEESALEHMSQQQLDVLIHASTAGEHWVRYRLADGRFLRRRILYVPTQDKLRLAGSLDCKSPADLAEQLKTPYQSSHWEAVWVKK